MNRHYHDRALSKSHRRHVFRRLTNKGIVLTLVMGVVCLMLALLSAGWTFKNGSPASKLVTLAYGVGGVAFIALHFGLIFAKYRRRRSRRDPRPASSREGGALLLVLALVAALSALCLYGLRSARQSLRLQEARMERALLQSAATEAVLAAMRSLSNDEDLLVDHAGEEWAQPWTGRRDDGISVRVRISDEQRRFDANNLALESTGSAVAEGERILADLLTQCGDFTPLGRVEALRDWVDADQEGYWESDHYRELDPPYACPDARLLALSELLHVHGWDRAQFEPRPRHAAPRAFEADLADVLTAIPLERRAPLAVNINTADRPVLNALFGPARENIVDYIVGYRRYEPFTSLDGLAVLDVDPLFIDRIRPFLDVKSAVFSIHVRAHRDRQAFEVQALVLREPSGRVRVLRWEV